MRCQCCNTEIEENSLFCSECGAKQEMETEAKVEGESIFCPSCGMKLEPGSMFCSDCGTRVGEEAQMWTKEVQRNIPSGGQQYVVHKKKGGSLPVILTFLLIAVLIVGLIGFAIYKAYKSFTEPQYVMEEIEETLENELEAELEEEIDFSEVDINAVENSECTLEGKIQKSNSGSVLLSWDDEITIYGYDETGEPVLAEDVTSVYVDEVWLDPGVIDSVAANEEVKVSGDLYIVRNSIYLEAETVLDENGKEITGETELFLDDEYVIPYSDTVLLTYADISGLSLQEINYAKNEIYARHGRLFKSAELQNYFNSKSWYVGTVAPENFTNGMLSTVEQKNAEFLSEVEFSMAPNGYQLDQ